MLLGAFDPKMSTYALSTLQKRGVTVMTKAMVTKITTDNIEIKLKAGDNDELSHVPYGIYMYL
jgi:NADH dehydrogenase FAD-containing subunit